MRPHRGATVLVLGILGLVLCVICGIIAWVMGNEDIRQMEAGQMDPSGLSLTKAGKTCGIVSVAINCFVLAIWLLFICGGVLLGAAGGM